MSGFDPTFTAGGDGHRGGTVPDPGASAGATLFLRQDAIFAAPTGVGTGTGGMSLISKQTLAAAAASVVFADIPDTYQDLLLVWTARATGGDSYNDLKALLNGDTGANYHYVAWDSSGAYSGDCSNLDLGYLAGGANPAGSAGGGQAVLPGYAGTALFKTLRS